MSERGDDLPKIVAVITVTVPKLVLSTGFAYLRMRRRARKSAKKMMKGLVENGMPQEFARKLSMKYETDLSVRNILRRTAFARRRAPE